MKNQTTKGLEENIRKCLDNLMVGKDLYKVAKVYYLRIYLNLVNIQI